MSSAEEKRKGEPTTKMTTNASNDLAFPNDNEFVELVWENGQILTKGQSSRARRNLSTSTAISTLLAKPQGKDGSWDVGSSKARRFGNLESTLNAFSDNLESSGHIGLDGHDEDMVPWLNYSLDDSLQHDYCSEFFSELTNGNMSSLSGVSGHANAVPNVGGSEPTAARPKNDYNNHVGLSPLHLGQTSVASVRSRASDYEYHQTPSTITKTQKQVVGQTRPPLQLSNNTGVMNFPHFSRATSSGSLSVERLKSDDNKMPASTLIDSTGSGSNSIQDFRNQTVSIQRNLDSKSSMSTPRQESEKVSREDAFRNTGLLDQSNGQTSSFAGSTAKLNNDKEVEPVVASSSLCSASGAGGASNDFKQTLKRKSRETGDFEYQSEDVEEESVDVRKPATTRGGGSKRSRAAEVHNLSERRRRDRINEKMRALQELIPNCNKVDKASMLDEAIEYLKTLQLQVQMMSMGAGMYIPPMMLPTGMYTPHFAPMGVGMGISMGYGMGMGMSPGMHFPRPPLSTNLPMMAGSALQMLGLSSQGHPMPVPRVPYLMPEGLSTNPVTVPGVSGNESLMQVPESPLSSSSKIPLQNRSLPLMPTIHVECSQNQSQFQTAKEDVKQSAPEQLTGEMQHISGNDDLNSTKGEENTTGYD